MNIIKYAAAAAILFAPLLVVNAPAKAATASQYSAKGHGRQPTMSNKPSRAVYNRGHRSRRGHRSY